MPLMPVGKQFVPMGDPDAGAYGYDRNQDSLQGGLLKYREIGPIQAGSSPTQDLTQPIWRAYSQVEFLGKNTGLDRKVQSSRQFGSGRAD